MRPDLPRPCLCLVTDRRQLTPSARTPAEQVSALEHWLDEAIGLVDLVQIRERDLDAAILCALTKRVVARARGTSTRVMVNDRSDVAIAAAADGVHLRGDGPPIERVRTLGPAGWLVGRSVHSAPEAHAHRSADYLVFGTVFPSASKPGEAATGGLQNLMAAIAASGAPVLAIGGITAGRAGACRRAGAAGVAAIGVFLPEGRAAGAMGIRRAATELRAAFSER